MDDRLMTLMPSLVVRGADEAIAYYQRVLGAQLMGDPMRIPGSSTVMHAELKIGNSMIFLVDECPQMRSFSPKHYNGTPVTLQVRVPDCDKTYNDALAAGAQNIMPPADMFWGDRYAQVIDPFGHVWGFAAPKEKLTREQIDQRAKEFMATAKR
ncbi:MAG: VOC family protein [Candidatus Korobacteraceae bacterium]|jgi:uncharacterized glyoxalase superfamily protein PhnB